MTEWAVIDANLLLLLIVGRAGLELIAKHKRLRDDYAVADYLRVEAVVVNFGGIVVLPQVLAEVSNFARQIADPARTAIADAFAALIRGATERWIPGRMIVAAPEFRYLGFTDGALVALFGDVPADRVYYLLTADQPLASRAQALGHRVINYREL